MKMVFSLNAYICIGLFLILW